VSRQIKKIAPFCRIIILAGYHKKNHLRQLLQMRVSGIVHKSHALKELSDAIDTVLRGGVYWSPKIGSWLMEDYVSILAGKEPSIYNEKLTERQKEVLKLIAEGKGTKEIALHLKTSIASVESLRYRLMHKLNVNNMADLIKYALQEGIIDWNI
jgi:DNA-binding NarL/FixJ family response regulator